MNGKQVKRCGLVESFAIRNWEALASANFHGLGSRTLGAILRLHAVGVVTQLGNHILVGGAGECLVEHFRIAGDAISDIFKIHITAVLALGWSGEGERHLIAVGCGCEVRNWFWGVDTHPTRSHGWSACGGIAVFIVGDHGVGVFAGIADALVHIGHHLALCASHGAKVGGAAFQLHAAEFSEVVAVAVLGGVGPSEGGLQRTLLPYCHGEVRHLCWHRSHLVDHEFLETAVALIARAGQMNGKMIVAGGTHNNCTCGGFVEFALIRLFGDKHIGLSLNCRRIAVGELERLFVGTESGALNHIAAHLIFPGFQMHRGRNQPVVGGRFLVLGIECFGVAVTPCVGTRCSVFVNHRPFGKTCLIGDVERDWESGLCPVHSGSHHNCCQCQ